MKIQKIPMRGGVEQDALGRKSKNLLYWETGERKSAKKSYNRRVRRLGKVQILREM